MESFTRSEKKYLLTKEQYTMFFENIQDFIEPDIFEKCKIKSIYYDNEKFELIRRSIEKPQYKEKFRIRGYGDVEDNDYVFVEIKKKMNGVVYKRRTEAKYKELLNDIKTCKYKDEQIGNEIKYAINHYGNLKPVIYVSSFRTSYVGRENHDLRITFDKDLKYRMNNLNLYESNDDKELTKKIIMEIKVSNSYPLWLTNKLTELSIFPRGYSKVGTAFIKEKK